MASKRRLRRNSCASKRRFPDHDSAFAARWKWASVVYHCEFCGGYHLGHNRNMLGWSMDGYAQRHSNGRRVSNA